MHEQTALRKEAIEIMERLHLIRLLERYGEARVVGSVVLELIVKLDLDVQVHITGHPLMAAMNAISNELLDNQEIREVRISDYRPRGIKIGIDRCPGPSGNWTIDIWLTTDRSTTAFEKTEMLLPRLTSDKREIILSLKQHYYSLGSLRDGISSVIYDAVLNGISDLESFEASPEYQEYVNSPERVE